ncbi:MAG: hypothetical protein IJ867_07075 [Clostridia bacterium]|nr:hypothetical protein [Clostridia bacterium]
MIIGIISNAQKAKIDSERADLWERIQEVLVEAFTIKFDDVNDRATYINGKFNEKELDATCRSV